MNYFLVSELHRKRGHGRTIDAVSRRDASYIRQRTLKGNVDTLRIEKNHERASLAEERRHATKSKSTASAAKKNAGAPWLEGKENNSHRVAPLHQSFYDTENSSSSY